MNGVTIKRDEKGVTGGFVTNLRHEFSDSSARPDPHLP